MLTWLRVADLSTNPRNSLGPKRLTPKMFRNDSSGQYLGKPTINCRHYQQAVADFMLRAIRGRPVMLGK
jgi:hypothetical protein